MGYYARSAGSSCPWTSEEDGVSSADHSSLELPPCA
jgi:hypothetical protein